MKKAVIISLAALLQLPFFVYTSLAANETKVEEITKKPAPPKKPAKTSKKDAPTPPTPEKKAEVPTAKILGPAYLTTAFDQTITKVSVPFFGHDIEQIYNAFTKRNSAKKDEFETTVQYQKRVVAEATAPLFGSVTQDSKLVFFVSPDLQPRWSSMGKYDADSQIFTMVVNLMMYFKQDTNGPLENITFNVKRESHSNLTTGQNAYGAQVEITEKFTKDYSLVIRNLSDFETKKGTLRFIESQIRISPAEAKALKNNILALLVVKPVVPYTSNYAWDIAATFKSPVRSVDNFYYVETHLLEIWFINKETGEVLAKIKPKNTEPVPNK